MQIERDDVFTVSEVNFHVRHVIESSIPKLFVEGEIANFTHHRSGHIYFSLKDENSTLRCVFFRGANLSLKFQPKNGDKVICVGMITVYEKAGNYQLNVSRMLPSGIGDLQQKFEELKQKLQKEGLFDVEHKKTIPEFPQKIGVITSATGAAIEDIRNVIKRRFPTKILLYPATVQGDRAAPTMIKALQYFNKNKLVDVIILGRGGGSQEDLFCFNDEKLARVIFASKIPIISAVGHEIDFTISDFVADLRAPTPSAAAELAVPNKTDVLQRIDELFHSIASEVKHKIFSRKLELQEWENELQIHNPEKKLQKMEYRLAELKTQLSNRVENILQEARYRTDILDRELIDLSPKKIMERGFSLIRKDGKIVSSIAQLQLNDLIEMIFADGKGESKITKLEADEK